MSEAELQRRAKLMEDMEAAKKAQRDRDVAKRALEARLERLKKEAEKVRRKGGTGLMRVGGRRDSADGKRGAGDGPQRSRPRRG
jgi:hypothetical protein